MLIMSIVRVNTKCQITIPLSARKKLSIREGDSLLVDVQDGMIILIPQPRSHADSLAGLHSEIWVGVDTKKYLDGERNAWASTPT
jgi:AbrB family looped-hinge helix DNA binding protein